MSEPKIIQIVHVPNTDHAEGGLFALCENGELLAGQLVYADGRLKVEWTHVPVVDPAHPLTPGPAARQEGKHANELS